MGEFCHPRSPLAGSLAAGTPAGIYNRISQNTVIKDGGIVAPVLGQLSISLPSPSASNNGSNFYPSTLKQYSSMSREDAKMSACHYSDPAGDELHKLSHERVI